MYPPLGLELLRVISTVIRSTFVNTPSTSMQRLLISA
jgi:hypothetical protein